MLHVVQHVGEKAWDFSPCRRRVGPFIQAHAGFGTDRVSPVNNTRDAVAHPKGIFAAGRVEWDILFRKMWHQVPHFPEKDKKYHAAAGESGLHLVKRSV